MGICKLKKKRKSLEGWTMNKWGMQVIEHSGVQDIFHIEHDMIFRTKSDAEDMLRLPDGKYRAKKVRITIEEI